jgi:hypothetical protein
VGLRNGETGRGVRGPRHGYCVLSLAAVMKSRIMLLSILSGKLMQMLVLMLLERRVTNDAGAAGVCGVGLSAPEP